jgi:hypothetical protein
VKFSKKDKESMDRFTSRVNVEGQVGKDMSMLRDLVGCLSDVTESKTGFEGQTAAGHLTAFTDILGKMEDGKLLSLSERQRAYLKSVHKTYCESETYKNLWSAGKVERGREVITPDVLRPENLPKRPPTRRPSP